MYFMRFSCVPVMFIAEIVVNYALKLVTNGVPKITNSGYS